MGHTSTQTTEIYLQLIGGEQKMLVLNAWKSYVEKLGFTFYVIRSILIMIKSFTNKDTKALFERRASKRFKNIERVALRKLVMLHAAKHLNDLEIPPGNKLEALKRDRLGQHSIRINRQWRICFNWNNGDIENVEICDYH